MADSKSSRSNTNYHGTFSRFSVSRLVVALCIGSTILFVGYQIAALRLVSEGWLLLPRSTQNSTLLNWSDAEADIASSTHRLEQWRNASTLVMVAGHAIYMGRNCALSGVRNEKNWYLEPFQHGMVDTFIAHIRRGVEEAAKDLSALLIFSGGETRPGIGPRSEASTYWLAADALDWFGNRSSVQNRCLAEEYARDSFENLLFSICRFRQIAGRYPEKIIVVSFAFKGPRFGQIHRRAIRFPKSRFEFIGIDPPRTEGMRDSLSARERAVSMGPFSRDPYGCHSGPLQSKRVERNPLLRFRPYPLGCPELSGLFRHCGPSIYRGTLPWDKLDLR